MSPVRPGRRAIAGRIAAAAVVFGLPLFLAGPARADLSAAPTLGGWNLSADGNAVDIVADNATGLSGVHPLTEADFPEAESQFQTGPFGSGLATVFWPGSAVGGFGALSAELGLPSQLQPIASQLNYPVKAAAQYPLGPTSATYPPGAPGGVAVMTATAQPGGTTAEAALADQAASSVLRFGSAKGTSSATAAATATASATSELHDVSLLGGIVDIGSVTSTASALSDGTTGSGSAVTHVAGITVMGQPASIGSDGLVIPQFPSALGALTGPLVQNAVSQVISGLGLTVTEFPASQAANGAGFTATSGGVSIGIDPPSSAAPILEQAASVLAPLFPSQAAIIPTLPGLLQNFTLTITLGRATAAANASPPFNDTFNLPFTPPPAPVSTGTGSTPSPGTGSAEVAPAATGSAATAAPSVAVTPSAAAPTTGGTVPGAPVPAAALISLSSPLGAGAIALGVLAAVAVALGLWRLGRMMLPTDAGPVCPLGEDQP